MLAGILAGGHVLLEDVPGLGKTLAARSFAQALGLSFRRVQFTPDLLPSDVTAAFVFDQRSRSSCSGPGRSSPGCCWPTRSTARRRRHKRPCSRRCRNARSPSRARRSRLPRRSTCSRPPTPWSTRARTRLPEAQLDRFLLRVLVRLPDGGRGVGRAAASDAAPPGGAGRRRGDRRRGLLVMQQACEAVTVDETVGKYCVELAAATRRHRHVLVGASPRGSLGAPARRRVRMPSSSGRDFVVPEDVKAVATAALAHRMTVRPELWLHDISAASVVARRAQQRASAAYGPACADLTMTPEPRWRATHAHLRAVVGGLLLLRRSPSSRHGPTLRCWPRRSSPRRHSVACRRPSAPPRAELRVDAATCSRAGDDRARDRR